MKTLKEWQLQLEQHGDHSLLVVNLKQLGEQLAFTLKKGLHESPKFLETIGHVNGINKLIADIEHGNIPNRQKWLTKFYEWQGEQLNQFAVPGEQEWLASLAQLTQHLSEELQKYQGEQFPGQQELAEAIQGLMKVVQPDTD